jgi:sugar lactone lactonase YvrE
MIKQAEIIDGCPFSTLGEGVMWHPTEKVLYWVDITPGILHRFDPKTGQTKLWPMGAMIGTVVPASPEGLVVALETGIFHFTAHETLVRLYDFPEMPEMGNRFNDGKCDPSGRLWIGTMNKQVQPHAGSLYCFDGKNLIPKLADLTIPNGMAWSADKSKFYFIDTVDYEIVCFDFDNQTGIISNSKRVIEVPPEMGVPDGMTIDREDKLWIAHWGGFCVARWDPNNGKLLEIIKLDAPNVTSCTFGGDNLQTLYISTAREGLDIEQLVNFPMSGSLFFCTLKIGGTAVNFYNC